MDENKVQDRPRAKLILFIIAWFFAWWLASQLTNRLLPPTITGVFNLNIFIYVLFLGTLQYFVIRQFLRVKLLGWIPLSAAGALVGIICAKGYQSVYDLRAAPPYMFALYAMLLWSTPPIFQWFALRGRFRYHLLWLLAAVALAPLVAYLTTDTTSGVFKQLLPLIHDHSQSLALELQLWLYWADTAIAPLILGIVLYVVMSPGGKSKAVAEAVE